MLRSRLFLLLLALILIIYLPIGDAAKSKKTTKKPKASDEERRLLPGIVKILDSTQRSVLPLSDSNFTKFVQDRPREYHAAIILTASAKKYQCTICTKAMKIYRAAAKLYTEENVDLLALSEEKRIVFFVADVDTCRNVFNAMQIETVPRVFILPPKAKDAPKQAVADFEVSVEQMLHGGVKGLLDEIRVLSGVDIVVKMNPKPVLTAMCILATIIAYFWSRAREDSGWYPWNWHRSSNFWCFISFIVFSVGVSGSISCIIRSAPLYGIGRDGAIEIFADANREQYVLEGLVIAAFTLGAAMSIVLLFYSTKLPYALLRHVVAIAAMSMFIVFGLQVWNAYIDKTRWYSLKETIPEQLWAYLTATVKKKSWLPKRLLRLSEYWLYEYKDWEGFQKRAKTLLIDYLLRIVFAGGDSSGERTQ